jgi:hypothetical protein
MTYATAGALQAALYQHLSADTDLAALVGSAIYDAVPSGPAPALYVLIGEEQVRSRGDASGGAALHQITISLFSGAAGFAPAKAAAAAVCDALQDAALVLARGRLTGLWFERAQARRVTGSGPQRRIDLRFRARTEDD